MTSAQNPHPWHLRVSHLPQLSLAAVAALLLAGCSALPQPTEPSATTAVVSTPMFASDEEALAAAKTAYGNYITVSDQIARDGGANTAGIESLVTRTMLRQELESFANFHDSQIRATGSTTIDSFRLQSNNYLDGTGSIFASVCLDVSLNRVVDSFGSDVTPEDRMSRIPLEIGFSFDRVKSNNLLISSSDVWSGKNFC